ncbi:hypothetical protein [Sphingomonas sp. Leaf28]|uniref:hypothetical protein n=1 Tax=Sphingomonas sp. Leaf28 TaxID=1735695 RepID=UPI0012E2CB99|nr:hypothetical protein [Sphingomonas sp. Leaf28]
MKFADLLRKNRKDVALIIGNGIHQFSDSKNNSWDSLLATLSNRNGLSFDKVPKGASATEFFDVLALKSTGSNDSLARAFCDLMGSWKALSHHKKIVSWAIRNRVPILTTNFDEVLGNAAGIKLMRPKGKGFTDYYPWDSRFALELNEDPTKGFGIWHINGMARYARSIRLGLTHYMGSAQRVRGWLHIGDGRLFATKDDVNWPGSRTWLHIIFNKPLIIFGLGLGENEVFLRWLLIERARYFAKFPDRRQSAWFIQRDKPDDDTAAGRRFFLEGVGIECIDVTTHSDIYESPAWDD